MITGRRLRRALRGLTEGEQRVFIQASQRFHRFAVPRAEAGELAPLSGSRRDLEQPRYDRSLPQRFERPDPERAA